MPIVQLGGDEDSKLAIARRCCAEMGLDMWRLDTELVPDKVDDIASFSRLWTREAALLPSGLHLGLGSWATKAGIREAPHRSGPWAHIFKDAGTLVSIRSTYDFARGNFPERGMNSLGLK